MGRKKIVIQKIDDSKNRNVTFNKRKIGLMKKAIEISVLCGVEVGLFMFGKDTLYKFSSSDMDQLVDRYHAYEGPMQELSSEDLDDLKAGKLGAKFEKTVKKARDGYAPTSFGGFPTSLPLAPDDARLTALQLAKPSVDTDLESAPPMKRPKFQLKVPTTLSPLDERNAITNGFLIHTPAIPDRVYFEGIDIASSPQNEIRQQMTPVPTIAPWTSMFIPSDPSLNIPSSTPTLGSFSTGGFYNSPVTCWMMPSPMASNGSTQMGAGGGYQTLSQRRGSFAMSPVSFTTITTRDDKLEIARAEPIPEDGE